MYSLIQKNRILIIWLLLLSALVPYIYISIYANPIADDFTYAFKGKGGGFTQLLIGEYLGWNGRYTSNVFVLLNPIVFDKFWLYKMMPIGIIISIIGSFYFFIRVITNQELRKATSWLFAFALTLIILHQIPIISEGIYWYTGAVTYQLGCSSLLIYLGFLIRMFQSKYMFNSKYTHLLVTVILLFLTIGFNEILMIACFIISGVILLIAFSKKMNFKLALIIFILSGLFSAIVYFAPGNSVRSSYFSNNHQLIYSLGMSIAQTFRFLLEWISSIPLILISVLYYFANKKWSINVNLFSKSFYLRPAMSIVLLLLVVFIGSFPAYWSTGILGQHRTMNVSYFLFVMMWFVCLTVFFNHYKIAINEFNEKRVWGVLVLIWMSFLFTKNGYYLIEDLRSKSAYNYNVLMEGRYDQLIRQEGTIYFKAITNPPKTLFVLDITNNPHEWQNRGYNTFFGVTNDIKIKQDEQLR